MDNKDKLIFVYNADDGMFNKIIDSAHKIFVPNTYQWNLCVITHGAFSMRDEWKNYMQNLNYETRFYHRNGFAAEWRALSGTPLPAVFVQRGEDAQPRLLVSAEKMNEQKSVAQFTALLGRLLLEDKRQSRA